VVAVVAVVAGLGLHARGGDGVRVVPREMIRAIAGTRVKRRDTSSELVVSALRPSGCVPCLTQRSLMKVLIAQSGSKTTAATIGKGIVLVLCAGAAIALAGSPGAVGKP